MFFRPLVRLAKDSMSNSLPLVDRARLFVKGGKGGDGAVLYTAHKRTEFIGPGAPSGGAGGRGGSIHIEAAANVYSLGHLPKSVHGKCGGKGMRKKTNGKTGASITLKVPLGVSVWELRTGEVSAKEEEGEMQLPGRQGLRGVKLADLTQASEKVCVAVGGPGGLGNTSFRPHDAGEGSEGEARVLILELKSLADVGLVGLPNAGKSTLLGALSRACPKIAPYPFTTLAPHIGKIAYKDHQTVTLADLPGLVEGAHLGYGLGIEFLRHIERTHALVFVIDASCSAGGGGEEQLRCLRKEVEEYSAEMVDRPWMVVMNKCDLDTEASLKEADRLQRSLRAQKMKVKVIAASAKEGVGVGEIAKNIRKLVERAKERWERRSAELHEQVGSVGERAEE